MAKDRAGRESLSEKSVNRPLPGSRLLRRTEANAGSGSPLSEAEFERLVEGLSKKTARELGLGGKLGAKPAWTFYCPQCRTPRSLRMSPSPWNPKHLFQVALTTGVFTLLASPWLSWKGVVAFVPLWAIFEVAYRLKLRSELYCRQCGLDPVLYLADVNRARDEMVSFWKKKYAERGLDYPPSPGSGSGSISAKKRAGRRAEETGVRSP